MRIFALVLFALTTVAALPAAAQFDTTGRGGASSLPRNGGISPPPGTGEKASAPPPSVPGAKPRPDSVTPAPANRGTADLAPTEALFDAINRGDIASARDAINRGADLDSTNLLGLTPIELSVDLARNDISFLLLSMRGASGSSQAARQPAAAPSAPVADRRARRPAPAVATRDAAPRPARAPVLFAGNGGAPVPSAGFLGFDPHR